MNNPAKTVHPIHFEDLDGKQFERLVFAYHLRSDKWSSLEWYGQVGGDLGRDIWGSRKRDGMRDQSVCVQCANRKTLPTEKVIRDINKVLKSSNGKPDLFRVVCSSPSVSAKSRDKIKNHAKGEGIEICEIWSGPEFEENVRFACESVLKRFVQGDTFPDDSTELKQFVNQIVPLNDQEMLKSLARAFDRPAFHTPFHSESSLPAFKQAITDTIQVINTGIWQTRDGKEIGRLPSKYMIKDQKIRIELNEIGNGLEHLRSRFDELIKTGEIKPCGCHDPNCPVFFFRSPQAEQEMDNLRSTILARFSKIHPDFRGRIGW